MLHPSLHPSKTGKTALPLGKGRLPEDREALIDQQEGSAPVRNTRRIAEKQFSGHSFSIPAYFSSSSFASSAMKVWISLNCRYTEAKRT